MIIALGGYQCSSCNRSDDGNSYTENESNLDCSDAIYDEWSGIEDAVTRSWDNFSKTADKNGFKGAREQYNLRRYIKKGCKGSKNSQNFSKTLCENEVGSITRAYFKAIKRQESYAYRSCVKNFKERSQ